MWNQQKVKATIKTSESLPKDTVKDVQEFERNKCDSDIRKRKHKWTITIVVLIVVIVIAVTVVIVVTILWAMVMNQPYNGTLPSKAVHAVLYDV